LAFGARASASPPSPFLSGAISDVPILKFARGSGLRTALAVRSRSEVDDCMAAGNLFGDLDLGAAGKKRQPSGEPRVKRANRTQRLMQAVDLDALIASDHSARLLWEVVEGLDLSRFYEGIRARGSNPGRATIDPKILVALWLFATSQGVGSARALSRLCDEHDAYRWICGGVSVNHHTLSDFRVDHERALDRLLTQVIAAMMDAGIVKLRRVAQDGTRVRAHAGSGSFRRKESLQRCLREAKEQVETLKKLRDADDPKRSARKRAAAERAARGRERRISKALLQLEKVRESQERNRKLNNREPREPRASTTDPETRVMRMADGGYRPAYNMQLAVDTESTVIVGARVSNSGGDMGQLSPTLVEIEQRTGCRPADYLVDGGYAKPETVDALSDQGITIYAPPPKCRDATQDRFAPRKGDSPDVATWRQRMGTDEAKAIYKERASTIELTNAHLKELRGLQRMRVTGVNKVQCVLLWSVLAFNLMKWISLMPTSTA